jgi:beta-lactamase class A
VRSQIEFFWYKEITTDPYKPRVAEVNGDVMPYAASLPKIAIALGAFVQMERGKMTMDDNTRKLPN